MNKKLSDIDKRIIKINKRYNLADANGKIKILENALLSYPSGHIAKCNIYKCKLTD